ncbi:hypothetical protein DEJ23_10225 [Curtobacterium sp. MCSS17_008]|uniref:hypothetical protein n=1 Tax=Curtobacterium sp. MCSS17_008 TaxID=2175647 RepID=UPI000DA9885D|nr:hypothetical protein [Curtobacterium sp. MCSS17_008]PZF56534.1 hypothetical protein DEJ23_10225 [Curtobacterium sp. MCSS17_008]
MVDDDAWSPPRRRNGIWWIVASGLLLPAGWIAWLLVALAGYNGVDDSDQSLAAQTTGSLVVTLVCAGVPLAGVILLLGQRRRDRSVTLVGPVACAVFVVLAVGTLGYPTARVAQSWAADEHQRAQPPTALETSRTQVQVEQDLAEVGQRAVRALGEDVPAGEVLRYTRECPLSNLQRGTRYTWEWSVTSVPEGEPRSEDEREADELPADEVERRVAPVREVFRDAGLRDADPYGWDVRGLGDGWLAEAYAGVTKVSGDVSLETRCFAGGPGDGIGDDE